MAENKVSEMFAEASEKFGTLIDANSVVGEPVVAGDGTMIVPISRVSFGFGGGGSEFDSQKSENPHFGGGMGGGASVKAEAFLVINNNNVRLIPMGGSSSPIDKIVDLMPDMIDKVNGFFEEISEKKAAKRAAKEVNEFDITGDEYDND
ncbi:MAG: GerW family sporulation protein [Hominilimicola sp.]